MMLLQRTVRREALELIQFTESLGFLFSSFYERLFSYFSKASHFVTV